MTDFILKDMINPHGTDLKHVAYLYNKHTGNSLKYLKTKYIYDELSDLLNDPKYISFYDLGNLSNKDYIHDKEYLKRLITSRTLIRTYLFKYDNLNINDLYYSAWIDMYRITNKNYYMRPPKQFVIDICTYIFNNIKNIENLLQKYNIKPTTYIKRYLTKEEYDNEIHEQTKS